ncbi:TPA: hypothetical protein H1012_03135 [archaeon]|nr:hypothetical protein [Candidatus Naiadarchaeales archaeon SRR2090159.bin1288]
MVLTEKTLTKKILTEEPFKSIFDFETIERGNAWQMEIAGPSSVKVDIVTKKGKSLYSIIMNF